MSDDPLDNLSVEEYDSYFRKECKMKMKCLKDNPTCLECVNSKCDTLKAEVEQLKVDCIQLQQEINCLRMEPCQLPKCVELKSERDALKAELAKKAYEQMPQSFMQSTISIQADRDRWLGIAEKQNSALVRLHDVAHYTCRSDICYAQKALSLYDEAVKK